MVPIFGVALVHTGVEVMHAVIGAEHTGVGVMHAVIGAERIVLGAGFDQHVDKGVDVFAEWVICN